jgi:DNA-binding NarL/FixJ family response regulator
MGGEIMENQLRVLIVGQDDVVMGNMTQVLAADEYIATDTVGPAQGQLAEKTSLFQPDIVLFAVHGGDDMIMKNANLVKAELPDVKTVLCMSDYNEDLFIEGMMEGINGFMLHDGGRETESLPTNMRILYEDEYILSGTIAKYAADQVMEEKTKQQLEMGLMEQQIKVSPRELDIIYLLIHHYSNKEIAASLGLKEKSVRDYVSKIYSNIAINRRDEAVVFLKSILE